MKSSHPALPIPTLILTALLLVTQLTLMAAPAQAGAPDLQGCVNERARPAKKIDTILNPKLRTFARVRPNQGSYKIEVNPTYYDLSGDTQRWLYFRQCAHINLDHRSIHVRLPEPNLREEGEADCLAFELKRRYEKRWSPERLIRTIERDLERLDVRKWQAVFGGPRRQINISECRIFKIKK